MKWSPAHKSAYLRYRVSGRGPFAPLLKEWVKVIDDYLQFWEKDCSWWHSERPALSIFSGAVWRCGGVALEEFAWSKAATDCAHQTSGYSGRCDLGFGIRNQNGSRRSFEAEAKHIWCHYDKPLDEECERAEKRLSLACAAAAQLRDAARPLALLFVSFVLSKSGQRNPRRYLSTSQGKEPSTTRRSSAWVDQGWFDAFAGQFENEAGFGIVISAKRAEAHMVSPGCAVIIKDCKSR